MMTIDLLAKIGCAFVTGSLIGIERQFKQRNAGLRTNALVSVGAAGFILVSSSLTEFGGDPSRIAAQIVSGVGFLGGGLILKDGVNVRGLNSAATIWCSAACGTLSGVGLYIEAFAFVLIVLFIHTVLGGLARSLNKIVAHKYCYCIKRDCKIELSEKVRQIMISTLSFDKEIKLNALYYKSVDDKNIIVFCEIDAAGEHIALMDLIISRLKTEYGIINAGWENKTDKLETI